jgi:hypothetical protein
MSFSNDLQNTTNTQKMPGFTLNRQSRNQSTTDYNGLMNEYQDLLGSADGPQGLSSNSSYMYDHDDGDYLHSLNTDFTNMNVSANNKSCSSGYGGSTSLSSSESMQNLIQAYETNSSFSNDSVFSTPTTPTTPNMHQELNKLKSIKNKSPSVTVTGNSFMQNYANANNFDNMQQQSNEKFLSENLRKLQCSLESFMSTNNNQQQASKPCGNSNPSTLLTSSNSFNQADYNPFVDYTGLNKNLSSSMNSGFFPQQPKRNLTSIFDHNADIQNNFAIPNEGIFSPSLGSNLLSPTFPLTFLKPS